MSSLTHADAVTRARLLTVETYDVLLDLNRGPELFGSTSTVRFGCARPGASTFVDIAGAVSAATLNGVALPLTNDDERLELPDLAADNELVIVAELPYSHSGEGLHHAVDPADGEVYIYAQCAINDTHRIFACFDQPDLKARITLSVQAPPDWVVLANGGGGCAKPGTRRFDEVGPMSPYLFTVCAGAYHSIQREHDGITLGWHCRRSLAPYLEAEADELFTVTTQAFDWYHEKFRSRYPFGDKYDQVFVPEFLQGAMENIGCVTARDEWLFTSAVTEAEREFRAVVIAHELAHMWFGNLVTLRWWDDLWLNESFAEYLGYRVAAEATRFRNGWASFGAGRKLTGYMADEAPSTHPVAPTEVADTDHAVSNLDMISYAKGASALRQLVAFLGDDVFLAGLRTYFGRFGYGNATLDDLIATMAEASGRDLTDWSAAWLREAGTDTLAVRTTTADGRYTAVAVEQSAPDGRPVTRPHRIRLGSYGMDPDGGITRRSVVDVRCEPGGDGRTEVPELVGAEVSTLLLPNDDDLTFAKIRLPDGALETMETVLPAVRDPQARALLWGACWNAVRAAEIAPAWCVAVVAAALPVETVASLAETMQLLGGRRLVDRYLTPADRPAGQATLAECYRRVLAEVTDDPGRRLAAARGLAECAVTDEQVALLRDWLADRRVPDGVGMDPELRWAVLFRLVTIDAAGDAEIDAELARDRTATGEVHATRCRAARPDPAAKATAFEALVAGKDQSNRHLEATGQGLWRPEHAELTAPYVPRFFAEVPATAAWRTPGMLMLTVLGGYPRSAVSADTVAAAGALLARDDVHPMLRHWILDEDYEMRLALASRERFGGTG